MSDNAWFHEEDGVFIPSPRSRGYWNHDSLPGRSVVGLLGHVIERRHGEEGMVPARFSVDMHRLARFRPVSVRTEVIRDGGRLRLVEAILTIDGEEQARAQCQFLRAAEQPPGRVWAPEPWDVPSPEDLPSVPDREGTRFCDWRIIQGGIGKYTQRRFWSREHFEVVDGQPVTPFGRAALAADFTSPWIHSGDAGVNYINTDVILQLHRVPRGEWLGFETMGHEASQAIAVGNCRVYDQDGAIGYISITALANTRR